MQDDSGARTGAEADHEPPGQLFGVVDTAFASAFSAESAGFHAALANLNGERGASPTALRGADAIGGVGERSSSCVSGTAGWSPGIQDLAGTEGARRRASQREREELAAAIGAYLIREGYVVRDAGPLDPNRRRIGFGAR